MTEESKTSLQDFIQDRLQLMQYCFTKKVAITQTGLSDAAFRMAASRLRKKSKLISPYRGFYVALPPQYQRRGVPPATLFVDELMNYVGKPYYVGLLTAASMFGAAHHAPQEFQVLVPDQMNEIRIKNLRVSFVYNSYLNDTSTTERTTETGEITVSTPEFTALDLVHYDERSGHLDNVATVLGDLAEVLDPQGLLEAAKDYRSMASVQRLGYILNFLGEEKLISSLLDWVRGQELSRVPLSTLNSRSGERDKKWEIIINKQLRPD